MIITRLMFLSALCMTPFAQAAESDAEELKRLHAEVVDMIGTPACVNVVRCRLLALGSLPCGGPSEYLAYAGMRTSDPSLLETKAAEIGFLQDELRKGHKEMGDCKVLPVPTLDCVNGRCVLVEPPR